MARGSCDVRVDRGVRVRVGHDVGRPLGLCVDVVRRSVVFRKPLCKFLPTDRIWHGDSLKGNCVDVQSGVTKPEWPLLLMEEHDDVHNQSIKRMTNARFRIPNKLLNNERLLLFN